MRKETRYTVMVGKVIEPRPGDDRTRQWEPMKEFRKRSEVRDYIKNRRERYALSGWEIDIYFRETTTKTYL